MENDILVVKCHIGIHNYVDRATDSLYVHQTSTWPLMAKWDERGCFTLNPLKKDSPHYNRVLRIYLSGTHIYNADINRPYRSDLSSSNRQIRATKVKSEGARGATYSHNFVRKSSFDEWKYIIVPLFRLLLRFIIINITKLMN